MHPQEIANAINALHQIVQVLKGDTFVKERYKLLEVKGMLKNELAKHQPQQQQPQ